MMRPAQALARRALQRLAHDAPQRALDHLLVLVQILRHRPSPTILGPAAGIATMGECGQGIKAGNQVRGFCCPVPLGPRVTC